MCLYRKATQKLKNTKNVRVFAPSGAWFRNKDKDAWIKALVTFEGDVEFIAGRGYDKKTDALVLQRFEVLHKAGVKVYELEPNPNFLTGIILFGDCAFLGLSSSTLESLRYFETSVPSHLEVISHLIDDAKGVSKLWKI